MRLNDKHAEGLVRSLCYRIQGLAEFLANDRRNCAHGLMIDSVVTAFALSWSLARFFSAFRKSRRATVLWTVQECNVSRHWG